MGSRVMDCSQYTSFQLMEGSKVLAGIPYSSVTAASCLEIWETLSAQTAKRFGLLSKFENPNAHNFILMSDSLLFKFQV